MEIRTTINLANDEGVSAAIKRARKLLLPPPDLKPSEWAEEHCRIPAGNAIVGPVRFRNAPYQVEPMDMLVNPDCRKITLQWGAQTGKSQVQLMMLGYNIDQRPQSQMMMQPTQGDLKTWLNAKLEPLIDSTPNLKNKIAAARGRDGVNNQSMKQYVGGFLMFAIGGSTRTMRGRSAPVIFIDEADALESTDEGSPIELLWQRAATFGDQRKLILTSTPTIKGESFIESAFLEGDQRRFYCPCPHCDHKQVLQWSNVIWDQKDDDHDIDSARYVCEKCASPWDDADRMYAVRNGEWRASKPWKGHASYHLNELYSCFRKLRDIVQSFLDKKHAGDLQSFINVSLGETYEIEGAEADPHEIAARRQPYDKPPADVTLITAGVDVQDDRIEIHVYGHGKPDGKLLQSWGIEYEIFYGDPGSAILWRQVDDYLFKEFERADGVKLRIAGTCIDSGGHYTQTVYDFVRGKSGRRIFAIKGVGGEGKPIVGRPTKNNKGKVPLYPIGVDTAKEQLVLSRLKITKPGPGYIHWPAHFDDEFFEQLTAEKLVTRYVKGFPKREWKKTRPRNEALDCAVYAMAAERLIAPNYARLNQQLKPVVIIEDTTEENEEKITPDIKPIKRKARRPRGRRGPNVSAW